MASLEVFKNVKEISKIDKEIKNAKASFRKILEKKRVRKLNIREEYTLTFTKEDAKALHELIGNISTEAVLKFGMTKKQDEKLFDIYSLLADNI